MKDELIKFDGKSYQVSVVPAQVDFSGYQAMKEQIDRLHDKYHGYISTSDSYTFDKKVRAELNKLKERINQRKIAIVREADQPVNQFKAEIKDLLEEIGDTTAQIGQGITALDEKVKKDKHRQNLKRITELCQEAGIAPEKIAYNPRWDNKTASAVALDQEVRQQLIILQQKAVQYADNVKAITDRAAKLGHSAEYWVKQLDYQTLSQVLNSMDKYANDIKAEIKRNEEAKKAQLNNTVQQGNKLVDKDTGEIKDTIYTLKLELKGTKEQMNRLYNFIKQWNIQYKKC